MFFLSTAPSSHICTPELSPHRLTTHSPLESLTILRAWLLLPEAKILLPIQVYLKRDFLFRIFLNCLLSHNPPSPVKLAYSLCESVAFYLLCVTALFMFAGGMIGCVCLPDEPWVPWRQEMLLAHLCTVHLTLVGSQ